MRWRELTLDELLAADIVRQVMKRDGVDPDAVRVLMRRVARKPEGAA